MMLTALAMAAFLQSEMPETVVVPSATLETTSGRAADEAVIREGAAAWAAAFTRGDAALVDQLLADDFVGMGKDGKLYDKQTMLGWVRAGPNVSSSLTTVHQVRFFGDMAIATGVDDMIGAPPELRLIKSIWTDIWIRRDGRWQIVAAQDMAGAADAR